MDWATILLTAGTTLGGSGSTFLWLEARNTRGRQKRHEEISQRHEEISHKVSEAVAPVQAEISALHVKFDSEIAHASTAIRAQIVEALEPMRDQISTLNTKIEPLWKALEQLAINNANVLHHPVPERADLDRLLDHFRDNVLTAAEEFDLRRYLVMIKNYETGQDLGFPVYEGEPSAAANLLSMLDLVRIYRERIRQ